LLLEAIRGKLAVNSAAYQAGNFKNGENKMKTLVATASLTLCLLGLAIGAAAQEQLNFSQLPLLDTPAPMPNGYGQLNWDNFFYVNPATWSGAGPGYKLGTQSGDVAFVGGRNCRLVGYTCFGTISNQAGFQLVSATVAGGYGPAQITVTAYNNGAFLGSAQYFMGTQQQTLSFPQSWGIATQVMFQVTGQPGSLVIYNLSAYTLVLDPPAGR
jgi:hypothetical protein